MKLRDVSEPVSNVETSSGSFDLASAQDAKLYSERILRLLFMMPDDLKHRAGLGVGLQTYQGKPPTDENLRQIRFKVERLLDALPYVQSYSFKVAKGDSSNIVITQFEVSVDGTRLTIPEVNINGNTNI